MRLLPFDAGSYFIPNAYQWRDQALLADYKEYLGDMILVKRLLPDTGLRHPFKILEYFNIPYTVESIGERVWEIVEDVRMQVFQEMHALTGEEWRLEWSREDGQFCLFYRDRNQQRDATRDLHFVQMNTLKTISSSQIENSSIHGFGLLSTDVIPAGTTLCKLNGQILDYDAYERLRIRLSSGLGRMKSQFFMEWNAIGGDRVMVRSLRTDYSYINHSCNPNVEVAPGDGGDDLLLITITDIAPGIEFLLDYRREALPRNYLSEVGSRYLEARRIELS